MKKQNKDNKKQFVKICVFVILFIFLIPLIVNFIVETPNPFGLGFINDSNKDTWISFFGSIIGGSITLIGVIWTINYEKKAREEDFKTQEERRQEDFNNQEVQRKKELGIQYRPFLTMSLEKDPYDILFEDFQSDPVIFGGIHCIKLGKQKSTHFKIVLINLKNEGDGECYIHCINNELLNLNAVNGYEIEMKNNTEADNLVLSKNWHNVIPKNKSIILKICFAYNKCEKNNGDFYISYNLKSTDRFNYVSYQNALLIKFKVTYNEQDNKADIQSISKVITNDIIE